MASLEKRRLIVNADDFGLSTSVNKAVIRAHRDGILTTASLMVNESGCGEAVKLAKENPKLGVGLHLTLLMGHAALTPEKIPGLVNARGEFSNSPVGVGLNYFFKSSLREQLRAEIHAQFEKFHATGLPLDHVNGHLHLHLHPVIFKTQIERIYAAGGRVFVEVGPRRVLTNLVADILAGQPDRKSTRLNSSH